MDKKLETFKQSLACIQRHTARKKAQEANRWRGIKKTPRSVTRGINEDYRGHTEGLM